MKILMIIPLLLTLFSGLKERATTPAFTSITISPFYNKGESTIVVVTRSNNLHFFVFIQNDVYMNVCVCSDVITKAGTHTYKYDNSYTRNKNTVFVRYYTDTISTTDSQHFQRNIRRGEYEFIEDNKSLVSDSELVVVKSDGTYSTRTITHSFTGFDGLYIPSFYHKIDLQDFQINLGRNDITFFNCNPSLVIKNYNNMFDDIEGVNETATFYLKLKKQISGYTFDLRDDLYVNQETLRLSSIPRDGYVKTKYIYLPINEMQNQDKYECYLSLQEFGIDKDLVLHNFELRALRNTFGDCHNSKYCITRTNSWLIVFFIHSFSRYS